MELMCLYGVDWFCDRLFGGICVVCRFEVYGGAI